MDWTDKYLLIKQLIAAKILGQELSEEDNCLLEEWLAASDKHRALFQRVERLNGAKKIMQLDTIQYGEKMARQFMLAKTGGVRKRLYRRWQWCGGIAATAALIFGVWLTIFNEPSQQQTPVAEKKIVPGKTKAILTLASGQRVDVCRTEITQNGDVFVDIKGQYVIPTADTAWHTLTVPAGGEFRYTLADGTEVWLNSASELRFPTTFTNKERLIHLRGEAFFDVKKDTCHPFIVALPEGNITVYGTRFVVTSYQETPLSAVLVQGSIGFTSACGRSVRLNPEERLVYDSHNGNIQIEKVDVDLYTAWVNKMFVFRGQPLGEIMTTLSRWYDLDITFADQELRELRLSGRLNRYQDVDILLHTFEETAGIRFNIHGKNIVVTKIN